MSSALPSSASILRPPASAYRIIGVGNAGGNFLDRLLLSYPTLSGLIALNNDTEALTASVVPNQITLPADLEYSSHFSASDLATLVPRLVEEIAQASIVILVGGLGSSFASALLPHVAAMCKAQKKMTLACISLPFSFEGKRTQSIAAQSLALLEKQCDGILLLDNDRLSCQGASRSALGETFAASDEAMEAVLPALLAILLNRGPVRITRSHFLKALQRQGARSCFGYGQAVGPNRLHEALERTLKKPLLDRGRSLAKATDIFLLLRGPKDISLAEAQTAMQEIERLAGPDRDIQLSLNAEEMEGSPLQIFLLAITGGSSLVTSRKGEPSSQEVSDILKREVSSNTQPLILGKTDILRPSDSIATDLTKSKENKTSERNIKELFPEASYQTTTDSQESTVAKPSTSPKKKQMQGALNLKAVQRGRFDKSEPTIVEGEDLDTPTYLRLGLKF